MNSNTISREEKRDKEKGKDGISISNVTVTQFIQQMQQQMQSGQQERESKINGATEKIVKTEENQRVLEICIDDSSNSKAKLICWKGKLVMLDQFDVRMNALEENIRTERAEDTVKCNKIEVRSEIKSLKQGMGKLQANGVTTSSTKVKAPHFNDTTN